MERNGFTNYEEGFDEEKFFVTADPLGRVERNTSPDVTAQLDKKLRMNIFYYASCGPEDITSRLRELDHEWDVERYLEINAAALALSGLALGLVRRSRRWFLIPALALPFLLQHAIQGWCPPLPVLRRMGVRTRGEIDREKYALKMLRGDFDDIQHTTDPINQFKIANQVIKALKI